MSIEYLRFFSKFLKGKNAGFGVSAYRCYSQYSPDFIFPTFLKEDQDELLQQTNKTELEVKRIKAARSHETCSVFYDNDVREFVNFILRKGDRENARRIVEETFQFVKERQVKKYWTETNPQERDKIIISPAILYKTALKNCTPVLETIHIKRGGQYYDIPVAVKPGRATFLAMKFLILSANEKSHDVTFQNNLATMIITAANNTGPAVQKKLNLHKTCEANRAYAHYRWS